MSNQPELMTMETPTLQERVMGYLGNGGLFNPETMDSNKTRDLIIDCRDGLNSRDQLIRELVKVIDLSNGAMCQATFYMKGRDCSNLNHAISKCRSALAKAKEVVG